LPSLFGFSLAAHLLSRITPATTSSAAIATNIKVKKVMVVWFAKKFISVIFNMTSKRTQVNMRLVMIRNPPMAMLTLASFRITTTRLPTGFHINQVVTFLNLIYSEVRDFGLGSVPLDFCSITQNPRSFNSAKPGRNKLG
jgi:hypothetical protein